MLEDDSTDTEEQEVVDLDSSPDENDSVQAPEAESVPFDRSLPAAHRNSMLICFNYKICLIILIQLFRSDRISGRRDCIHP
jgi:hypothetical protein